MTAAGEPQGGRMVVETKNQESERSEPKNKGIKMDLPPILEEKLHGEWLVVNRRKKGHQIKGRTE